MKPFEPTLRDIADTFDFLAEEEKVDTLYECITHNFNTKDKNEFDIHIAEYAEHNIKWVENGVEVLLGFVGYDASRNLRE